MRAARGLNQPDHIASASAARTLGERVCRLTSGVAHLAHPPILELALATDQALGRVVAWLPAALQVGLDLAASLTATLASIALAAFITMQDAQLALSRLVLEPANAGVASECSAVSKRMLSGLVDAAFGSCRRRFSPRAHKRSAPGHSVSCPRQPLQLARLFFLAHRFPHRGGLRVGFAFVSGRIGMSVASSRGRG